VVDVPAFDFDPLHERAAVRMEKPVSLVVLDHVERVQVRLAMRAGLDLVASFFDVVAAFRIAKQTDISDNLADLDKFNRSLDGNFGVCIVDVAALNEDATV